MSEIKHTNAIMLHMTTIAKVYTIYFALFALLLAAGFTGIDWLVWFEAGLIVTFSVYQLWNARHL